MSMKGRRAGRGFLLRPTRPLYLHTRRVAVLGPPITMAAPTTVQAKITSLTALAGSFTVGSTAGAIDPPPPTLLPRITLRVPPGSFQVVDPLVEIVTNAPRTCPTLSFRSRPGGFIVGDGTVPGDPFGSPLELVGLSGFITVSLQGATPDPTDPNQVERTIWLKPPPGDGVLTVVGVATGQNFAYEVVDGASPADLEHLAAGQIVNGVAQPATAPVSSYAGDPRVRVRSFGEPPATIVPPTPLSGVQGSVFGMSAGAPLAANNPAELSLYFGLSDYVLFDYLQNEFAGLSGISHSNVTPLMKVYHAYDTGIPTLWTTSAGFGCTARNLTCVLNVKASDVSLLAGAHTSAITSFCADVPAGQVVYLIINAEPENDATTTASSWRASVAKFCKDVLDNRGSKKILPGFCLQSYTWHTDTRTPADWNPAAELDALSVNKANVIATWNGSSATPGTVTAAETFAATLADYRAWGFTRFGITEVACKSYSEASRLAAPQWTKDMISYVKSEGIEYATWLNSVLGLAAGGEAAPLTEGWFMYPAAQKIAWAQDTRSTPVPENALSTQQASAGETNSDTTEMAIGNATGTYASGEVTATATGTGIPSVGIIAAVPPVPGVTPGHTYTAFATARFSGGGPTSDCKLWLIFFDVNGDVMSWTDEFDVYRVSYEAFWPAGATTNTDLKVSGIAPPGAVTAGLYVWGQTGVAGRTVIVSRLGIWEGVGGTWAMPGSPILDQTPVAGPATLTWTWDSSQGGLTMDVLTSSIPASPASVFVSVINAQPNEDVDFVLVGIPGYVTQTIRADSAGIISRGTISIPPTVGQGTVTVKATGQTTGLYGQDTFQVLTTAPPSVTQGADAAPTLIAQTGVIKWVFQDKQPGGLGSYVVPLNPTSMTSPNAPPRPLTIDVTTAPGGRPIIYQGSRRPYEWRFTGVCKTEAFFDALNDYYALQRRFYTIDHRNRAWITTWEELNLVPVNVPGAPYQHTYEVKALIYGEVQL